MMSVLGSGVWGAGGCLLAQEEEVMADTMKEESDAKHFPCVLWHTSNRSALLIRMEASG